MGIYATQDDVVDYIEGFNIDNPEALERLISRAEIMIDQDLPSTGVFVDERKFDPTLLEEDQVGALRRATCAQVEYILYLGPEAFVEDRIHEASDGRAETKEKPRKIGPKALRELYDHGFIARTGRMV